MSHVPISNETLIAEVEARLARIDHAALRRGRLARLQAELRARDLAGCVLFDPVNMRYATGLRNYQVMQMHIPFRYAFVPADGKAVGFELGAEEAESPTPETVAEIRPSRIPNFFLAGGRLAEHARRWAADIAQLAKDAAGANRRIAVDRIGPAHLAALQAAGLAAVEAQEPVELARAVKLPEELAVMAVDIFVAEAGIARMKATLRPGMTENAFWSVLHETNAAAGGEWIECRLVASGPRTNPWGAECSAKAIEAGELVGFDTDMVGPGGTCADISRTLLCGDGPPSQRQKDLYRLAAEQLEHNMALVRPGISFRDYAERCWPLPEAYVANRYPEVAHGIGLCDEYPGIPPIQDWDERGFRGGYDGVIEENMTLCIESYIGAEGGPEGVKLEQQVLVTAAGCRPLSTFPLEEMFLT
ncbi:MAG: Xaa-Pro peptidase family protein [Kiloniellales bacterium]|nr:Xaa-Pro peptidase family protein [Kiloniellales bacterium]